jgi:ribokinase
MIVVFGSINVDVVVPVPDLPRPGETVLGGDYSLLPGGKGANQAIAARRAGADVVMAGAVGHDGFAAVALDPLRRAKIDTRFVRAVDAPTGCAVIMVAQGGENIIAVASGANAAVRHDQVPDTLLAPGMTLVAQMEVPYLETAAMIHRVRAMGGRVLLNLAPAGVIEPSLLSEIDLVVANRHEAAALGADMAGIGKTLRQGLIVTRGALGATAYPTGGTELSIPALPVEALDTTGAGDTFVGVLAAALDLGISLEKGLWRASAAAGLACRARGAQSAMPDAAAIDDAVAQMPRS